jgi:hypothetical protein
MKLGFTFYPQDWWSSDSFYDFDAFERYVYLECLFLMYRNGGYMKTQKTHFENRIRIHVSDSVWDKVTQKFVIVNDEFTSHTVNARLRKAITARENGNLGGRPAKITHKTSLVNQDEKAKEKEKEKEETEIERETFSYLGNTAEKYITIQPKTLGSTKYRVNGKEGLDELFQMHKSIISRPEFINKFLLDRTGKVYDDFRHVWNDYNQFVNNQFKK